MTYQTLMNPCQYSSTYNFFKGSFFMHFVYARSRPCIPPSSCIADAQIQYQLMCSSSQGLSKKYLGKKIYTCQTAPCLLNIEFTIFGGACERPARPPRDLKSIPGATEKRPYQITGKCSQLDVHIRITTGMRGDKSRI